MSVETTTYIDGLNSALPAAGDPKSEGDDHLRLIKSTVKATFPNVAGAVTPTHTQLNYVTGVTSAIQTQIDAKAPLASPALTGTPTAPTAAAGTNTTQVATTAHVYEAVNGVSSQVATDAATAAAAAATAVNAPGTSATSTTSLTIGTGAKNLTIQTGKSISVGMSVKIASTAGPTNWMFGDVTAYNSGTGSLDVNVTDINGSGTLSAWTVSLSGVKGVTTYPRYTIADKTTSYTVVAGDHANIIRTTAASGGITLPATTSALAGFYFTYVNDTVNQITIGTSGSDTFQGGEANYYVSPKSSIVITCTTASATGKWSVTSQSYTSSGANSLGFGGATASGQNAVAFTVGVTASGAASFAAQQGSATNQNATAFGGTASGIYSFTHGQNTAASAPRSYAIGNYANSDLVGKFVHGSQSPRGNTNGYSQYARTVLAAYATATSTNYVLTSDSAAAGATNQVVCPLNKLIGFSAIVSAGQLAANGTNAAVWKVEGAIRRGASGNVALVGTPAVTSISGTVPTGWTLTATADVTNQALALTFNMGTTAMTGVHVSAVVEAAEVTI